MSGREQAVAVQLLRRVSDLLNQMKDLPPTEAAAIAVSAELLILHDDIDVFLDLSTSAEVPQ